MKPYRRFSSVFQMSAAVLAFVCAALLLESGGIYGWAQRLELGRERRIALPVATALHHALAPLHLEHERERALQELARVRWSDDPALLASVEAPIKAKPNPVAANPAIGSASGAASGTSPATMPAAVPATAATPLQPLGDAPPLLSRLPEIDPVPAGDTRTVALAGDSMMAVGLSTTILRQAPKYTGLRFVKAFKSGTGLARPEVFNWQAEYPAMLKDAKPDYVLVAIGANDGQGFVDDGTVYPFGTDAWQAIYQRRVTAYLEMLEANGATVIWMGLPPMKSDTYDARIALVNRIDAAVVKASPHAIWFSTAGLVGDANGAFRDFGDLNGKTVRLRQSDGIHLSDEGAVLVVEKLLPWLGAQESPSTAPTVANPRQPATSKP